MAGGWRVRLKPGIRPRHLPVEAGPSRGTGRRHPDDSWQSEDHILAAEAHPETYDSWAVGPTPFASGQKPDDERHISGSLPTKPGTLCDNEAAPLKVVGHCEVRHDGCSVVPKDHGIIRPSPPSGPKAVDNDPLDEEELIWPVPRSGFDELVNEGWEEFERAEEAAVERPPEAVADEDALLSAVEQLDVEGEVDLDFPLVQDDFNGLDEWEDIPDRFGTAETVLDFSAFPRSLSDWSTCDDNVDDYDPTARQDVWQPQRGDADPAWARARSKAARITAILDIVRPTEQDNMLGVLVELFWRLRHHRTFIAIEALALEGITAEALRSMIALRHCWLEHPEWWVGRYGWGYSVTPLRNGAAALSWRLASRICAARAEFLPEYMVDPDWFDDWLALNPSEEAFLSFPDYLHRRVEGLASERLFAGLVANARQAEPDESADSFGWYRRLPSPLLVRTVISEGPAPLHEDLPRRKDQ